MGLKGYVCTSRILASTVLAMMVLSGRPAPSQTGTPPRQVGEEDQQSVDGQNVMAGVKTSEKIPGEVLPVELDVRVLETGLTVALVHFDSPGLAAYFTAMRVGSRDEVEPGHSGFAHLFEHMMFRGTKKLPGSEYDRKVQSLGADSSAWTWNDQTVYFFIAPTDALPDVIWMEAERFQNLYYEESEFKTESGAVRGEYEKNFSDPLNQMEEELMDLAFEKSTYKHTTMGFLEDIESMPGKYRYSLEFFDRHYVPGKAVIFVVGDFDEDEVMEHIRTQYAGWTKDGEDLEMPAEPEQHEMRRDHVPWKTPVLPQLLVGYKAPAYSTASRDYAALTVIGEMVFGKTSPLYRKLVLEEQIVEELDFWDWPHRDPALWIYHVSLKKEAFDEVLSQVDDAIRQIAEGATTPERLDAVKSHYRYDFVLGFETPRSVANQLSFYATLDGDPASADRFLAQVDALSLEDIRDVAAKYLVDQKRTVITLSHDEDVASRGDGE